jgi:hypothetical protein
VTLPIMMNPIGSVHRRRFVCPLEAVFCAREWQWLSLVEVTVKMEVFNYLNSLYRDCKVKRPFNAEPSQILSARAARAA